MPRSISNMFVIAISVLVCSGAVAAAQAFAPEPLFVRCGNAPSPSGADQQLADIATREGRSAIGRSREIARLGLFPIASGLSAFGFELNQWPRSLALESSDTRELHCPPNLTF